MLDFSHSKLSFRRSVWSYSKVQTVVSPLVRGRRIQLRHIGQVDYVNIGCGESMPAGFCNVDYAWRPGVLCWDITKGIPFATGSVKGVFSEHCLEHISRDQCLLVLRELRRILQPGGTARVVVPDGELYCRLYVNSMKGIEARWPYPESGQTPMGYVNGIMRGHGHLFIYDYQTLRDSMIEAGFRDVCKTAYRQGREPELLVEQEHRAPESLYVEGVA
jgi:predicted SAM-dependent methyltransferase